MIVPRDICGDGKAEVFGIVDYLKLLAVDIIICNDLITLVVVGLKLDDFDYECSFELFVH